MSGEVIDPEVQPETMSINSDIELVKKQIEYYFSRENLQNDPFLTSHMDSQNSVPISIVMQFAKLKALTQDEEIVKKALESSKIVSVVEDRIKSNNAKPGRSTIILREIAVDATEEEIREVFNYESCRPIISVRSDIENTWFVVMETEQDAKDTIIDLKLKKRLFRGEPVKTRLKSETIARSFYMIPSPPIPAAYPAAVGYPPIGYAFPGYINQSTLGQPGGGMRPGPTPPLMNMPTSNEIPNGATNHVVDSSSRSAGNPQQAVVHQENYLTTDSSNGTGNVTNTGSSINTPHSRAASLNVNNNSSNNNSNAASAIKAEKKMVSPSSGTGNSSGGGGSNAQSGQNSSRQSNNNNSISNNNNRDRKNTNNNNSSNNSGNASGHSPSNRNSKDGIIGGGKKNAGRKDDRDRSGGRDGHHTDNRKETSENASGDHTSSRTIAVDSMYFPPLVTSPEDTAIPTPGYKGKYTKYSHDEIMNIVKGIVDATLPSSVQTAEHPLAMTTNPHKDLLQRQRTFSIDETREQLQQGRPVQRDAVMTGAVDYMSMMYGEGSQAQLPNSGAGTVAVAAGKGSRKPTAGSWAGILMSGVQTPPESQQQPTIAAANATGQGKNGLAKPGAAAKKGTEKDKSTKVGSAASGPKPKSAPQGVAKESVDKKPVGGKGNGKDVSPKSGVAKDGESEGDGPVSGTGEDENSVVAVAAGGDGNKAEGATDDSKSVAVTHDAVDQLSTETALELGEGKGKEDLVGSSVEAEESCAVAVGASVSVSEESAHGEKTAGTDSDLAAAGKDSAVEEHAKRDRTGSSGGAGHRRPNTGRGEATGGKAKAKDAEGGASGGSESKDSSAATLSWGGRPTFANVLKQKQQEAAAAAASATSNVVVASVPSAVSEDKIRRNTPPASDKVNRSRTRRPNNNHQSNHHQSSGPGGPRQTGGGAGITGSWRSGPKTSSSSVTSVTPHVESCTKDETL